MPGWRGMLWSWLAVQADQLANWESFSGSRELLSRHCSLAGCTRGLRRHQTGRTQQVEAMDVYLAPFIKPKNQTQKSGPNQWNKALSCMLSLGGRHELDLGWMVPDWEGLHHPLAGWLPSSFLTVLKELGSMLIPLCQIMTLKQSFLKYSADCRSSNHNSSLRDWGWTYQDQVAPDSGWP